MSMKIDRQLAHSQEMSNKVALLFQKRAKIAHERFTEQLKSACDDNAVGQLLTNPAAAAKVWTDWYEYAVDAAQRSVLFWDTIRERGNAFVEHASAGLPPLLHFDYEMVVDGRKLARPVNYALVRIVPPEGVDVDPKRRPYVIIDPRAGHGPGIGGFKDDSQVGVALRDGHPVYFVIFFRDPEPGQTLLDVCEAEKQFVHKVRELHPHSAKPAIVGNCQGGWAAMMLAAADPDDTGPIVINGAPMSYWGGAWQEGEGDNPMRYAGGMLGGTWLASFVSDLGDGVFDGAYLVENFENLQSRQHVLGQVLPPVRQHRHRAAALSRVRALVGRLLPDESRGDRVDHAQSLRRQQAVEGRHEGSDGGEAFDLRNIKAPIILFASMGDNITPPQQAFNWVADVYGSTDEIKARGQVIVGLMHESVGHLGIFVSGKVAKKEHRADRLGAEVDRDAAAGAVRDVDPGAQGTRRRGGRVRGGVQRASARGRGRAPQPLRPRRREAVRGGGDDLRIQPARVRALRAAAGAVDVERVRGEAASAVPSAALSALGAVGPQSVARVARPDRESWSRRSAAATAEDNAALKIEKAASRAISASLDYYRVVRDATSEAAFFQTYGNVFSLYVADERKAGQETTEADRRAARAAVREGGAGIDRRGRICRGARARRVPARAEGRAPAAVATAAEAGADGRLRRSAARDAGGPVAPRTGRAGDHRSL